MRGAVEDRHGLGARLAGLLAAALLLAWAPPAQADGPAAVTARVAQAPREVASYWTEERMREALPAEQLLRGVLANPLPPNAERGKAVVVRPTAPAGATRAGEARVRAGAGRAAVPIPRPRKIPLRTHGRVFLTLDGVNYYCSGTVVNAKNRKLVVTAGHCIYDQGRFASNWMFIPAYNRGKRPFGQWTAKRLAVTPAWRSSAADGNLANDDLRYDVGMATMRVKNGRRLQGVVGARGIAFNRARERRYRAYGFPSEPPFDGQKLHVCASPYQGADNSFLAPRPIRITCDMTGGSSGGGMIVGKGVLSSVISYGYECDDPPLLGGIIPCPNPEAGNLFGPYFGTAIRKLYRSQSRKR